MAKISELYPPYAGDEPYVFFCFSDPDASRACTSVACGSGILSAAARLPRSAGSATGA